MERFYLPDRGRDFEEGSKCPARAHVPSPPANILVRQLLQEKESSASRRAQPCWSRQPQRASVHRAFGPGVPLQATARRTPANPQLFHARRSRRPAGQPDGGKAACRRGFIADAAVRFRTRTVCTDSTGLSGACLRHHLDGLARRAHVGREPAQYRPAYSTRTRRLSIAFISSRARGVGLNGKTPVRIPIAQLHIADTLGLSLVHTNKTIRKPDRPEAECVA